MRHKQVLDTAADHPDASIDEIASKVPSATPELVERVLEEHGDPANDEETESETTPATKEDTTPQESSADSEDASGGETAETDADEASNVKVPAQFDAETLTEKQRAVLELVAADPSATQREIGDRLGISAAAVSNRVNAVPGFDWNDRAAFVKHLPEDALGFEGTATSDDTNATGTTASGTDASADDTGEESGDTETDAQRDDSNEDPSIAELQTAVDELRRQIETLETQIENVEQQATTATAAHSDVESPTDATESSQSPFDDPELVQKVAHACLSDEAITEDEERQILRVLLCG
nr:winged helix-turn-helix domain-containing protein [Halovenus carboxidivorans]